MSSWPNPLRGRQAAVVFAGFGLFKWQGDVIWLGKSHKAASSRKPGPSPLPFLPALRSPETLPEHPLAPWVWTSPRSPRAELEAQGPLHLPPTSLSIPIWQMS